MKELIGFLLVFIGCGAGAMPLTIALGDLDSGRLYLPCFFDGRQESCFLDTGAAFSSIAPSDYAKSYPAVGSRETGGASGERVRCDVIQINDLQLGEDSELKLRDFRVDRCEGISNRENTIGINAFVGKVFKVSFSTQELSLIEALPDGKPQQPLQVTETGHVIMSAVVGYEAVPAYFDTGAGLTSIDQAFVDQRPEQFTYLDQGEATDSVGKKVPFKLYNAKSIRVGTREFRDLQVLAMDFSKFLGSGNDPVLILGFNLMSRADWCLDLRNKVWTVE